MTTRAVVISNPNASRAREAKLNIAIAELRRGGITVDVAATKEAGHGDELARAAVADGADLLIAHGGDGTLMEVAPTLVGTGRPLGILPAGTGNRLADNLGIPWNPLDAARLILKNKSRDIDIGRIVTAERIAHFAVCGGCGFDAEVMHRTSARTKRTWGVAAYVGTAIGMAMSPPRAHMRIETESEVLEREAVTVLLANCAEILPTGIAFSKGIKPDDGYMDVIVMDASTFAGAARVAWRLAFAGSTPDESLQILRAKTVKITTDPPLAAQADGDPCGKTPLTADVLEGGLTVLAPPAR